MSVRGSGDWGGREAESQGSHPVSWPNGVEMAQETEDRWPRAAETKLGVGTSLLLKGITGMQPS